MAETTGRRGYAALVRDGGSASRSLAPAGVAALLAVTLAGGVAAAASFPSLPPPLRKTVAVPSLVAQKLPLTTVANIQARILAPGGSFRTVEGTSDSVTSDFVSSNALYGAAQSFYDDAGRHLVVIVERRSSASDADAKDAVNGANEKNVVRSDDGIWTSTNKIPDPLLREAAGIRGSFVVAAFLDGDPSPDSDVQGLASIVRAQLASMDDAESTPAATDPGQPATVGGAPT